MTTPRELNTATLLPDGTVLIAGGTDWSSTYSLQGGKYLNLASAEIYHPAVLAPAPVLFSLSQDGRGQGAILHSGTDQAASPGNPAIVGEALEIYYKESSSWPATSEGLNEDAQRIGLLPSGLAIAWAVSPNE